MFIAAPRLYFCVGNKAEPPSWRLLFQPVIALPNESTAPLVVMTSNDSLARFAKVGLSYWVYDTDEGNGKTLRHIESGEKKIVSMRRAS